ncbi:MAG: crotonase/enoyl-CoA hydratase family protein [Chloroflexi bacterium]|nr:crotonase/enoyl-CoA hydratase family protein [Chloroflexota bacterium]
MSNLVLSTREGSIVMLTLNKPEMRNVLSDSDMIEHFIDAIERINEDQSIRCVILTGAGKAFSSGGNLKQMGALSNLSSEEIQEWYATGIQRIPLALSALEIPIIAAVNGPAIGAGCDLACMCDIRIAGQSASFAESFVKLGLIPGDGGAWFLPRVVGLSKACEMAFTGDALNADEALACGLVSRVVPDAQLLDEARTLARRIAVNPGYALRMTKRLIREAQQSSLEALLKTAAEFQARAHGMPEHKEAVTAFLEKRPPRFADEGQGTHQKD